MQNCNNEPCPIQKLLDATVAVVNDLADIQYRNGLEPGSAEEYNYSQFKTAVAEAVEATLNADSGSELLADQPVGAAFVNRLAPDVPASQTGLDNISREEASGDETASQPE